MTEGEYEQFAIPQEVVALIVALSQNRRIITPAANMKTVYTELRNYTDFVARDVIKLAATLALLCQKLADGKNKKTIRAYWMSWRHFVSPR